MGTCNLPHDAANTNKSIWRGGEVASFYNAVKRVHKRGQVASCVTTYSKRSGDDRADAYYLPQAVEFDLAQAWAFIAAASEGAHHVSAATVQVLDDGKVLKINVATNAGVPVKVQSTFREIGDILQRGANARRHADDDVESIFKLIIRLCENKIRSRFRCNDWKTPKHYRGNRPIPFHKQLQLTLDHISKQPQSALHLSVLSSLRNLSHFLADADRTNRTADISVLEEAIRLAGAIEQWPIAGFFDQQGIILRENDRKAFDAFDKVANYMHVSRRLMQMATQTVHSRVFMSIEFCFLNPYEALRTEKEKKHVHAEIQLAIHHRLERNQTPPRTIGTSKGACYLCDLFLSLYRPRYTIAATHGTIYEDWTIPDVKAYSEEDRKVLRVTISGMRKTLDTNAKQLRIGGAFPNQSKIYIPPSVLSLVSQSKALGRAEKAEVDPSATMEDVIESSQELSLEDSVNLYAVTAAIGSDSKTFIREERSTCPQPSKPVICEPEQHTRMEGKKEELSPLEAEAGQSSSGSEMKPQFGGRKTRTRAQPGRRTNSAKHRTDKMQRPSQKPRRRGTKQSRARSRTSSTSLRRSARKSNPRKRHSRSILAPRKSSKAGRFTRFFRSLMRILCF